MRFPLWLGQLYIGKGFSVKSFFNWSSIEYGERQKWPHCEIGLRNLCLVKWLFVRKYNVNCLHLYCR